MPFGNSLTGIKGILAKGWQGNGLISWNTRLALLRDKPQQCRRNASRHNQLRSSQSGREPQPLIRSVNGVVQHCGISGAGSRNHRERTPQPAPRPRLAAGRLSVFKTFDVTERFKFEFRTEAFNVLNTAKFAFPTAQLGSTANGKISSTANAYSPRVIQFAGKVYF